MGLGKKVVNIADIVDTFEAQEGVIEHIIGKTGNGKTYEGTRRAIEYLQQGFVVYTTWRLIIPDTYDERDDLLAIVFRTLLFWKRRFYVFDFRHNWHFLDIDRPDLIEFVAGLTDCIVFLDEGQDIFDSYEGTGMSKLKRKSLTRTRHLRKTLIIISQRAQAVAVTARANVQYYYRCVKSRAWFWPFAVYFRVYRTEEMDNQNFPIWEDLMTGWQAEQWSGHFAKKRIYDSYNSWYLRAGIPKSQEVRFEAYDLSIFDKVRALLAAAFKRKNADLGIPYNFEAIQQENLKRHIEATTLEPKKRKSKKTTQQQALEATQNPPPDTDVTTPPVAKPPRKHTVAALGLLLLLFAGGAKADTLLYATGADQSEDGTSNYRFGLNTGDVEKNLQSFNIAGGGTLNYVKVWLSKTGLPTDNVDVDLYAASGNSPTGSILSSGSLDANTLTGSCVQYQITMSPFTLTSSQYVLVFSRSGGLDSSNHAGVCGQSETLGSYTNGVVKYFLSGSWSVWSGSVDAVESIEWWQGAGGGGGSTTTATSTPFVFANFQELLFMFCTLLFFISYAAWARIFRPIGLIFS